MTRFSISTICAFGVPLWLAACTQILDIEDARVDPSLSGSHGGSFSSSAAELGGEGNGDGDGGTGSTNGKAGSSQGGSLDSSDNGSASNAGSAIAAASNGQGGAPQEATLCERYCDEVTTNCKAKYEQYRTFDQCVEVCKRLPAGNPGDEDVDSVECRLRQAEFAESEPFVYCKSAGPLGAGRCGSNCVSYCSLMQATCSAESTAGNAELSYFESSQACLEACGAIPEHEDDPAFYSSSGSSEPTSWIGNNVYCRVYHLASALENDTPDEHCPHAMGGDPCIEQ